MSILIVSDISVSGTLSLSSNVVVKLNVTPSDDTTVRTGSLAIYASIVPGVTDTSIILSNQPLAPVAGVTEITTLVALSSLSVNTEYYLVCVASDSECADITPESIGTYGPFTIDRGTLGIPEFQVEVIGTTAFVDCRPVPNAIGYEVLCVDGTDQRIFTYKAHGVHPIRDLEEGKTYLFQTRALGDGVQYQNSDFSSTESVTITEDKKVQSLKFNIETRTSPWYYGQPKTQRSAIRTYVKCTSVVDVADGEETPSKVSSAIFAYRLCNGGEFFDHVCSSVDMIEMGEGTPEYGVRPQWVRRDYVDMLVPCVEISDECIRKIKEDIYYLAKEITSYITTIGTGYDAIEVDYET